MTARSRDRLVYAGSHPILYGLLMLLRRTPFLRIGSRVVVNDLPTIRQVLTEVPLDRTDSRVTGGVMRKHDFADAIFDESGEQYRSTRRAMAKRLDSRAVDGMREIWQPVIDAAVAELRAGRQVDISRMADDLSGRTAISLLGLSMDSDELAAFALAARQTASSAAAAELPSLRPRHFHDHLADVADLDAHQTMLAMATVVTTYAALPRAVAWVADDDMWDDAASDDRRPILVNELLRVIAPTPILPRVPSEAAMVNGRQVRAGEQLLLMVRNAIDGHNRGPCVDDPAPYNVSQLVFGAGRYSCPGSGVARAQMSAVLEAFAPLRPRVVKARPDKDATMAAWRSLVIVA